MKQQHLTFLYGIILVLSTSMIIIPIADYRVGEGHSIAFQSADPSGKFKIMTGNVRYSADNPSASSFNLSIAVNSINTGNGMMNKKALTKEWFDQPSFPKIEFQSTSVYKDANGVLQIKGVMTLKGVKRTFVIPASVSGNPSKYVFKGSFYVNRIEFGVGKKSATVPDKMKIIYELPIVKK
ncbi:MAG: YceI family protein [Flavobacteriia bacterium]|nr:YceI family protein [Flavobacteriia bacterium]